MEQPLLVYTTFPDEKTALAIGEPLVRDGLAACLNILPGMRSVYRWEGRIEQGEEVVGIIKTVEARREALTAALKDLHPYDTPVILYLAPEADPATLAWLVAATRTADGGVSA
ncbi:divalent-cation tolerance protein CutA [Enterovirga rhinocerotis]|uniref:divalent-cation tolerance protein CutA n=1 Tax=Enterovirga rhinocerotis TaxID=1339210 RepID=UPI001060B477|nr:divalent-cation tolerance protein CutA [Enterovirga rhinocerotis]